MSGFPPRLRRGRGAPQEFRGVASKGAAMGWVVKQWRLDTLERLLAESVRAELASTLATAERDGRRARRAADRASAAAERELSELEEIGAELRTAVRDWRVWLRDVADVAAAPEAHAGEPPGPAASGPDAATPPTATEPPARAAPAPTMAAPHTAPEPPAPAAPAPTMAAPHTAPEPPAPAAPPDRAASPRRRRPARASLHSSALTELFRATAAR
jgi:hypothetical protein